MSTHHVEIDEATLVLRALEQGTALASHGVPGTVEVIAHDVDHIQGPGCGKQDEERLPHQHQQAYTDSLAERGCDSELSCSTVTQLCCCR